MVEMLSNDAGIRLVHVPYKGLAPVEADLLAGHIDLMFDNLGSALPYITSGKFKALAVTSESSLPELPGIPTLAATYPGYVFAEWFAFLAPPKTPPAIAATLAHAVAQALKLSPVAQRFRDLSVTPLETRRARPPLCSRRRASAGARSSRSSA